MYTIGVEDQSQSWSISLYADTSDSNSDLEVKNKKKKIFTFLNFYSNLNENETSKMERKNHLSVIKPNQVATMLHENKRIRKNVVDR